MLDLLVVLLNLILSTSSTTTGHYHHSSHRNLHQPFFPLIPSSPPSSTSPPAQPPDSQLPFFTYYHYPSPPPPSSTQPPEQPPSPPDFTTTFPSNNISSLLFPKPVSSSSSHHHSILVIALSVSFLSATIIAAALASFLYYHKNRNFPAATTNAPSRSDNLLHLYPPNIPASDGGPKPCQNGSSNTPITTSSQILYLGTLGNSHGVAIQEETSLESWSNAAGIKVLPYWKLNSPELKPLPPLPRHGNGAVGRDGNKKEGNGKKEYFSPRGSSGGKRKLFNNK